MLLGIFSSVCVQVAGQVLSPVSCHRTVPNLHLVLWQQQTQALVVEGMEAVTGRFRCYLPVSGSTVKC